MKSNKIILCTLVLAFGAGLSAGCGSPTSSSNNIANNFPTATLPNGPTLATMSGNNVLPITVNGSLCASGSYPNKPCVSVTICSPNGANCQKITDILVDTGSFGLRVFSSVLNSAIKPTPVTTSGGGTLAECVQYGDGSSDWGPVETVQVQLGGENPVSVPIQVIDSTFATVKSYCSGADTSPSQGGYNGILGVGVFAQDCGAGCTTNANNGSYFSCTGATCAGSVASLAQQVQSPVALLHTDNNGVVIELPSVPVGGVSSASGYLVLGIGTETNNQPSGVTAYNVDPNYGEFTATFEGQAYSTSFLDTGSNGFFFTGDSSLPACGGNFAGFFCPTSVLSFSGLITAFSGAAGINVPFQIGDAQTLPSSNNVFVELGGDGGGVFDWGLPFHLGRNVYVGLENSTSTLGAGPLEAF